jgi:hypothetical protein
MDSADSWKLVWFWIRMLLPVLAIACFLAGVVTCGVLVARSYGARVAVEHPVLLKRRRRRLWICLALQTVWILLLYVALVSHPLSDLGMP